MDNQNIMKYQNIGNLSYPCIFAKDPEDAIDNLFRLISKKQCGFDEGIEFWKKELSNVLSEELNIKVLNSVGTTYSHEWWEKTLSGLFEKMKYC